MNYKYLLEIESYVRFGFLFGDQKNMNGVKSNSFPKSKRPVDKLTFSFIVSKAAILL